jgi:hypothetical protein
MNNGITKYKGLQFRHNIHLEYLELLVDNDVFCDNESYIFSISIMAEYAIYIHPKYLVINKLDSVFELNKELIGFTNNSILKPLKEAGVRKIIMLVSNSLFEERYSDIELRNPFMIAFRNGEDMNKWIIHDSSNKHPDN